MNAKDINIGGVIFHIEENGFPVLDKFLKRIQKKAHFDERKLNELENEITEIFLSLLSESKFILKLEDIQEMIEIMELRSRYKMQEFNQFQSHGIRTQILEIAYQQLGITKSFYY